MFSPHFGAPVQAPASRIADFFRNYLCDLMGAADLELVSAGHLEEIHARRALSAASALGVAPVFDRNGSRSLCAVVEGLNALPVLDLQTDAGRALAQYLSIQLTRVKAQDQQKRYRLFWLGLAQGVTGILDFEAPAARAEFEAIFDEMLASPGARVIAQLWENSDLTADDILRELGAFDFSS